MKFFSFSKPVIFNGRDMCGFRPARLQFSYPENVDGWEPVRIKKSDGSLLDLTLPNVEMRRRGMVCIVGDRMIDAVEHLASLRFLYPGIILDFAGPGSLYVTNTGTLVSALAQGSHSVVKGPDTWFTAKETVGWEYPNKRNGKCAYTSIEPNQDKRLRICVQVSFKGLGEMYREYIFPNPDSMRKVFNTPSPGLPTWLEWPARILWYHGKDVLWQGKLSNEEMLEKIIHHRVLDILGALALVETPVLGALPSLTVISQCSGHLADFIALKMITTVQL